MSNGRGTKRGGGNRRDQRGSNGLGPLGVCICVKCGYTSQKELGVPCMDSKCPNCGTVLFREGGSHYMSAINKKK